MHNRPHRIAGAFVSTRMLYACNRSLGLHGDGDDTVIAYTIDPKSGELTYLNQTNIPPEPA